jgi:hypothetical protein
MVFQSLAVDGGKMEKKWRLQPGSAMMSDIG